MPIPNHDPWQTRNGFLRFFFLGLRMVAVMERSHVGFLGQLVRASPGPSSSEQAFDTLACDNRGAP